MRSLRTASTGRLLASVAGVVAAAAVCAAVAVAATSGGPVPKREPLAQAIHQALRAKPVSGITARISFTNNLIAGSEIQGSDPLLQGGSGRMWLSSAGHMLRLEIQGSNGDAQVVLHGSNFWAYDPSSNTVYEGKLPARQSHPTNGWHPYAPAPAVPSVAKIQAELSRVMRGARLSGAIPGDIAGQPAYTVRASPRRHGGLLGAIALGWDAVRGVPLRFSVFARGVSTPVLDFSVTDISYGRLAASSFAVSPPAGARVVRLSAPSSGPSAHGSAREVTGVAAVKRALPFKLDCPGSLAGMRFDQVRLVHMGSHPAALLTYGQGLGGIAVLEAAGSGKSALPSAPAGEGAQGLTPPTVSIHGTTGQELDTALGSVISFSRDHVAYTVLGSVTPAVARSAARGL